MKLSKKVWVGWRETTTNRQYVGASNSGNVNTLRPEVCKLIWDLRGESVAVKQAEKTQPTEGQPQRDGGREYAPNFTFFFPCVRWTPTGCV